MRMPTFSRHTGTTTAASDDEPTLTDTRTAPAGRHSDEPTLPIRQRTDEPTVAPPTGNRISTHRPNPPMTAATAATIDRSAAERAEAAARAERTSAERAADRATNAADREPATAPPVVAGPRPRASLLATLGLITGVASALLVLSGPLAGYGIGLAVLALILSLGWHLRHRPPARRRQVRRAHRHGPGARRDRGRGARPDRFAVAGWAPTWSR